MSKKSTKALASATVMSLVLTTALSAAPVKAAAGQVTRTSGSDRYQTASQVAKANWKDGAKEVVLVSGEGYADAVSASVLAKTINAPILLSTAQTLSTDAKEALETLKPEKVYVIGGNASISKEVRDGLKAKYTLVELSGQNRYETNVAVANELVKNHGIKADNVMVVGGEGFSDALSVAPIAATKGQILLLGNNSQDSMKSVVEFVKANKSQVKVIGTENVINAEMMKLLGTTDRVNGGSDRFDTNLKVLAAFKADLKADKLYVANASGNGYADALVASALAGKSAAPLVLVDNEGSTSTSKAVEYIKANATKTTDLNVVGGKGVVSDATVKAIDEAVGNVKPDNKKDEVSEIKSINLNQFDVVFDSNVDEDTAESASYYKVAGKQLTTTNSHLELINDNTVRVTLVKSEFDINQGAEKTVSIKKGILTEDKTQTIQNCDKKIKFGDVKAPVLKDVSIRGNNKLIVEFSEAVNISDMNKVKELIEVNGKNISNAKEKVEEKASNGSETWASKLEFYFNSGLKSGENTIKVKDSKDGVLVDAGGFTFEEEEKTFSVDKVTDKPVVKEITCTDDGEIRVTFNRAMDQESAAKQQYYTINDSKIPNAKVELKENDTQIKITKVDTSILKDDANILEIQDGVKDAYGNKIEDETRKSFNKEKDETNPELLSATIIDNETLRVQFSEDVNRAYAIDLDNYELKDSANLDIMKKSGVYIKAASDIDEKDAENTDTFDVKFDKSTTKLDSSKYTLTVKDIVDVATEPNKMAEKTINIDGNDDQAPKVEELDVFQKSSTEVAIYFGKEMDSSSITNRSNYYYINGDGESKDLPDEVDINLSKDNKGVVIDFDDANKTVYTTSNAPKGDDSVKRVGIKTVKDASGNELFAGALDILAIDDARVKAHAPKLEENTFKLYTDGDDVKAEFLLDTALDKINPEDFKIVLKDDKASGDDKVIIAADDADYDSDNGKKITLKFADSTGKADKVKALGSGATLEIAASKSEDLAGRNIVAATQAVYHNEIAPETDRDNYTASLKVLASGKVGAEVNITMKTPVDEDILGSYKDDFVFVNGSKLEVTDVIQKGHTLVFTVEKEEAKDMKVGDKIDVTAATNEKDIDMRSQKDGNKETVDFVATSDDKIVKTVTVQAGDAKTELNVSIRAAEDCVKKEAEYTKVSFADMKAKLDLAKQEVAKADATQESLKTAKTNLDKAVVALVKLPIGTVTNVAYDSGTTKTNVSVLLDGKEDISKYVVKVNGVVVEPQVQNVDTRTIAVAIDGKHDTKEEVQKIITIAEKTV